MGSNIKIVRPYKDGFVITEDNVIIKIPDGWSFLPAGDSGITRKLTSKCSCYRVQVKKGRRFVSLGLWAPEIEINLARDEVQNIRSTDLYKKKKEYVHVLRDKKQDQYHKEFVQEVKKYLSFNEKYKNIEEKMALFVTDFAIPIGSGTVARTKMIPLKERASKAVIAWMRHNTTDYDSMKIPLIKGKRREIRRNLATESIKLLDNYRRGLDINENCKLNKLLEIYDKKK